MPGQTIAFRPTAKQLQVLEQWIASHQEPAGEQLTPSDALRAAVDALETMEKRRAQQREHSRGHSRPRVTRTAITQLPGGKPETIYFVTELPPEGTYVLDDDGEA